MGYVTVTEEQARTSPYFGFDGWLIVFYVYAAWSAASTTAVVLAFLFFEPAFPPFGHVELGGFHLLMAIRAVTLLPFLILTPLKHPMMPIATIVSEWVNAAIASVLTPSVWTSMFEGMHKMMVTVAEQGAAGQQFPIMTGPFAEMMELFVQAAIWQAIVIGIAMTALFTWYLLASKRVNATYRHRLPQ